MEIVISEDIIALNDMSNEEYNKISTFLMTKKPDEMRRYDYWWLLLAKQVDWVYELVWK